MSRNNHEQDIKDRLRLAVKVTITEIIVIAALGKAACTGEITTIITAGVLLTACLVGITAFLNINKRL